MEYGKDTRTPRDRADDALLRKLLEEPDDGDLLPCFVGMSPRMEEAPDTCMDWSPVNGLPPVMSYTPDSPFDLLYEPEDALTAGTLFRALEFPFFPGCGGRCQTSKPGRC